jgi:phosphoglycolate phosphatase
MNIKYVWFDFAGTLYKETLEFHKIHDKLRYETYAKLTGINDPETAKNEFLAQLKKYGSNTDVFQSLGQSSSYWMKTLDNLDYASVLKPDTEVTETLSKLKDMLPISIFTNFDKQRISNLLSLLQIPVEYFTYIINGDDVPERKPALNGFHEMVNRSGLPADQNLYICDRVQVDVKPAKQVGLRTCLLYSESPEADFCLENFSDILSLFNK